MGKQTENITIDNVTYSVTQLGTTEGVALGHRLIKCAGPAIVKFFDQANAALFQRVLAQLVPQAAGAKDVAQLTPQDIAALLGLASDAVIALDEKLRFDLEKAFKEATFYKDDQTPGPLPLKLVYDDHFAGRYGAWLKWFIACARFNFIGFFPSTVS